MEPNGGKEREALEEIVRVAREYIVLIEPIYKLAGEDAKKRMRNHGYVKGLKNEALELGVEILNYRLLLLCSNYLNPSGLLLLRKFKKLLLNSPSFICPLTNSILYKIDDKFMGSKSGFVYPVFSGIPILDASNAILASKFFN